MKALVPSGGHGLRLRPITYTRAKQLVPVAGRPVLFRVLDHIREAGIKECIIVTGTTSAEIERAVGDGSEFGMRVQYVRQKAPRGLADCVKVSKDLLGDSPFVMYLGDNMLADGIADLVEDFKRDPVAAQILTVRVEHPERFGVVTLAQDGSVKRVDEKPQAPASDLALAGVYLFDSSIHEVIEGLQPSARGELEITDAIQGLIERGGQVRSREMTGWWKDTGLPGDLLEANRLVLSGLTESVMSGRVENCAISGQVIVEEGAVVEGGALIGPCFIGRDATLLGTVIGPNVAVGAGCLIEQGHIADSIIMDNCTIRHSSLDQTLLGVGVTVEGRGSARLVVGDHGSVTLG